MRSRGFAVSVLMILALVLTACGPLPSLLAPTETPVTSPLAPSSVDTVEVVPTPVVAITPTLTTPSAPTVAMTTTLAVPSETSLTPGVTALVPVTPTGPSETAQQTSLQPMSTYRDEVGGFEVDYPVSWSVVDVTPEIKLQSVSYSVTFMSWSTQEPGSEGIPAGGSKLDISVTRGIGATPEAAVETRRQEVTQGDPSSQITFEEPWDLGDGLTGTHWTVQTSNGETVHEFVTAINGNRVVASGLGDAGQFEQIGMTLRPLAVTAEPEAPVTGAAQAPGTPTARAKERVLVPMASVGASDALAAAQPQAATIYIVRQGDTLAKIAARFRVTVSAILRANPQVTNPDRIYIGQRLTIPSGGGTQPPPAGTTRVNIYMIGMGGGSVGCGDEVVAVRRDVPKTAAPLTAALNLLLAQRSQYYGESGLYNALYQSNLRIASITRSGSAWTIRLTGSLRLGGVCDNPRVKAQLESTALQFSTVQTVRYYINGQALETVLSGN